MDNNTQSNNTSSQIANSNPQTGQNNRQATLIQNMLSNTQAVPPEEFQFNRKLLEELKHILELLIILLVRNRIFCHKVCTCLWQIENAIVDS